MLLVKTLGLRLLALISFKPDFTNGIWTSLGVEHRVWPFLAFGADLLAQFIYGAPSWLTLASSALTPLMLWFAPRVLATAIGGLMTAQALISLGLVWALKQSNIPPGSVYDLMGQVLTYAFSFVCLAAILNAVLQYLRTRKVDLPD